MKKTTIKYAKREVYIIDGETFTLSMVSKDSFEIFNNSEQIVYMGTYTECKIWLNQKISSCKEWNLPEE